jgi:hypothetical protein
MRCSNIWVLLLNTCSQLYLNVYASKFSVLPGLEKSITLFEGPQASLLPRLLIVALNIKRLEHRLTNIDG